MVIGKMTLSIYYNTQCLDLLKIHCLMLYTSLIDRCFILLQTYENFPCFACAVAIENIFVCLFVSTQKKLSILSFHGHMELYPFTNKQIPCFVVIEIKGIGNWMQHLSFTIRFYACAYLTYFNSWTITTIACLVWLFSLDEQRETSRKEKKEITKGHVIL